MQIERNKQFIGVNFTRARIPRVYHTTARGNYLLRYVRIRHSPKNRFWNLANDRVN